jgi:hypothetical protein
MCGSLACKHVYGPLAQIDTYHSVTKDSLSDNLQGAHEKHAELGSSTTYTKL